MHKDLHHTIKPGQVYFVTFPKWPGTFDPKDNPWHLTSVFTLRANGEATEGPHRAENIPLGSRAIVLKKPGEGVLEAARRYNQEPTSFVRCLVTLEDTGHSFEAIVGVTELWHQDPRTDPVPSLQEQGIIKGLFRDH